MSVSLLSIFSHFRKHPLRPPHRSASRREQEWSEWHDIGIHWRSTTHVRYHEHSINVVCVGGESSPSRGKRCLGRLFEICLSEGSQTSERRGHRTKTQSIADNLGNASSFISIRSFACARRLRSRHFRPRAEMRFTPPFHLCRNSWQTLRRASSWLTRAWLLS